MSRPPLPQTRSALAAGLAYFALVFAAGFVLGMVRVPWLVPHLGVRTAELLEMPVMLVVIWFAARFVVRRSRVPASPGARLIMGLSALAWLLAAEIALAVLLSGVALADYIASRDPVSGSVYLGMLGVFAFMPLAMAWLRPAGRG